MDRVAFHIFWICAVLLIFTAGMVAAQYRIFPYQALSVAEAGFKQLRKQFLGQEEPPFWKIATNSPRRRIFNTSRSCDGLNLVTQFTHSEGMTVKVMDADGAALHEWDIDWFKIWPDAQHVPGVLIPKSRPGTQVHGAVLLENGNLIFNFEYLGLVCLDFDGNVVWRLPYQTHHSAAETDEGTILVCGRKNHTKASDRIKDFKLPFMEDTILEVSPEGKILHEWSILDLLRKNGKEGLIYIGSRDSRIPLAGGDLFHLNDVEPFSSRDMKEGFFQKGDILVSLRNIGTIFVFDRETEKIKFIHTGSFVRQHDPDFIDGDTISVFDNHTIGPNSDDSRSRVLIISARDQSVKTYYEGASEHPFYTPIMGKHQWLANGNLLLTESCRGRALEIDRNGEIVWEYNNYSDDGFLYLVQEASRLPAGRAAAFRSLKSKQNQSQPANRRNHEPVAAGAYQEKPVENNP